MASVVNWSHFYIGNEMSDYNREKALILLQRYTKSDSLLRHAYAVEVVMRKYAQKFGEDENKWGVTGLLHDFDYEKYPTMEEHPFVGNTILKEYGYEDDILDAIMGHADYTGVSRNSLMAKTLFACDELTGFIFAVTYVRPSKSVHDVKPGEPVNGYPLVTQQVFYHVIEVFVLAKEPVRTDVCKKISELECSAKSPDAVIFLNDD